VLDTECGVYADISGFFKEKKDSPTKVIEIVDVFTCERELYTGIG
jgi:hypothetical protein